MFKGYLPRVFRPLGWTLAGLTMLPYLVVLLVMSFDKNPNPVRAALELYHYGYAQMALPLLALIAASASIREDIEQRTLPLMLVRPAPVWALPFGKGLLWLAWCSAWLAIMSALLPTVGLDMAAVPKKFLALLLTFWAQFGIASFSILIFRRGMLWAALLFFAWDPLIKVLPPALQRMTFVHYLESIAQSRYTGGDAMGLLAQGQVSSPAWLAALVLAAAGVLAWGLSGLWLMRKPIGLAGSESEG
jgi:ABC-type transport system involved in multi-copper enzyme maturation permease subunit